MSELIGHRGLPTLAPENTEPSIRSAAEQNIEWIEIDVTMAGDGSLVIMHDSNLKLFKQPDIQLSQISKNELKQIDAGSWFNEEFRGVPLLFLDEMLDLVTELNLKLNLEIKVNPDLELSRQVLAVYETLNSHRINYRNLIVSSFSIDALELLRAQSSTVQIAVLYRHIPDNLLNDVLHLYPVSIHCDQSHLTAHQARHIVPHYPLYCYTVNDTVTFERLLKLGVSGIFSDRADATDLIEMAASFFADNSE
jgi:glycerophosphoryl diester phosphodiesterase